MKRKLLERMSPVSVEIFKPLAELEQIDKMPKGETFMQKLKASLGF